MTWKTASFANNSNRTITGNAASVGFLGGNGIIEVQGYGQVQIIDKGWSDELQAWTVQVGDAPQLWTYQGNGEAHWKIHDATSVGGGIYLTLSSNKDQEGAANVGTTKVAARVTAAGAPGDPMDEVVKKVIELCAGYQHGDLKDRVQRSLHTLFQNAGGGVASTFFNSKEQPAILRSPDSASGVDISSIMDKLAVMHMAWTVSQLKTPYGFEGTIKGDLASSMCDDFLGKNYSQPAPIAGDTAGMPFGGQVFTLTSEDMPSVVQNLDRSWVAPTAAGPATPVVGRAPGHGLAMALFDDQLNADLKAKINLEFHELKTPEFVAAYNKHLQSDFFKVTAILPVLSGGHDSFFLQTALYILYKLDADKRHYTATSTQWRAAIHGPGQPEQSDLQQQQMNTLKVQYDMFEGLIAGTTLGNDQLSLQDVIAPPFRNNALGAIENKREVVRKEPAGSFCHGGPAPMCHTSYNVWNDTYHGEAVVTWLNRPGDQLGPSMLGLRTGSQPNIMTAVQTESGGGGGGFSCFLAGTQLLLADGTTIDIDQVRAGARVLCHGGSDKTRVEGIVSSEMVHVRLPSKNLVFGFNDEKPFFTSGHVFHTTTGLRAIDPEAAVEENPWMQVGRLGPGDIVLRTDDGGASYEFVRVRHISKAAIDAGTFVYGLHLREGLRSYHVNGYLVALNYPEITMARLAEGAANLPIQAQKQFWDGIRPMENALDHTLGHYMTPSLAAAKYASIRKQGPHFEVHDPHKHHLLHPDAAAKLPEHLARKIPALSHVSKPYVIRFKHETEGSTAPDGLPDAALANLPRSARLHHGELYLDGEHVPGAKVLAHQVHWTRELPRASPSDNPLYEHGAMHVYLNRLGGFGNIAHTDSLSESVAPLAAPVAFTASQDMLLYNTKVSTVSLPNDASDDVAPAFQEPSTAIWKDGPTISYGWDDTNTTIVKLGLPNGLGEKVMMQHGESLSNVSTAIEVVLDANAVPFLPDGYQHVNYKAWFSLTDPVMSGYAVIYDDKGQQYEGKKYAWMGLLADTPADSAFFAIPRIEAKLTGKPLAVPHPLTATLATAGDGGLHVDDLINGIPTTQTKKVHELNTDLLKQAMLYHISDDIRELFFGTSPKPKPQDLGPLLADQIDVQQKDLLVNKFATAYIGKLLVANPQYSKEFGAFNTGKLDYFMMGTDDGTLVKEAAYTALNDITSIAVFRKSTPRLEDYIESSEGPDYWAKAMYDKLSSPFSIMQMRFQAKNGLMDGIHTHCSVLLALTSSGKAGSTAEGYDKLLWQKIMKGNMLQTTDYFTSTSSAGEFDQVFQQLILALLLKDPATVGDSEKQLQSDFNDLMKAYQISEALDTAEKVRVVLENTKELRDDLTTFLRQSRGPTWTRINQWLDRATLNLPEKVKTLKSGLGRLFGFGVRAYSVFATVQVFMAWDNLSDTDKADAIINTVDLTLDLVAANGAEAVKKLNSAYDKVDDYLDGLKSYREREASYFVEEVEMNDFAKGMERDAWDDMCSGVSDMFQRAETEAKWEERFAVGAKYTRMLGVVALAASGVFTGLEIKSDFASGHTTQGILGILNEVSIGLMLAAELAEMVLEETLMAALGPVGLVLGIVVALVGLFIHSDPPAPPPDHIQEYIDKTLMPFLDSLPLQPYPDKPMVEAKNIKDTYTSALLTITPPDYKGATLVAGNPTMATIKQYLVKTNEVGIGASASSGIADRVVVASGPADITITDLKPGSSYSFQVVCINSNDAKSRPVITQPAVQMDSPEDPPN